MVNVGWNDETENDYDRADKRVNEVGVNKMGYRQSSADCGGNRAANGAANRAANRGAN